MSRESAIARASVPQSIQQNGPQPYFATGKKTVRKAINGNHKSHKWEQVSVSKTASHSKMLTLVLMTWTPSRWFFGWSNSYKTGREEKRRSISDDRVNREETKHSYNIDFSVCFLCLIAREFRHFEYFQGSARLIIIQRFPDTDLINKTLVLYHWYRTNVLLISSVSGKRWIIISPALPWKYSKPPPTLRLLHLLPNIKV